MYVSVICYLVTGKISCSAESSMKKFYNLGALYKVFSKAVLAALFQ